MKLVGLKFLFAFLFAVFLSVPFMAKAASLQALPEIIDLKGKQQDILKGSINLSNNSGATLQIFTFVNNLSASEGLQDFVQPGAGDQTGSLANWIDISRAMITLSPKQSKTINYTITVNSKAPAGMYHARIQFGSGDTRDQALENGGLAAVMLNVEVLDNSVEKAQLDSFKAGKGVFFGLPATVFAVLENIGNRTLVPSGEIIIYNKSGEEVGSIPLNKDGQIMEAGKKMELAGQWRSRAAFGHYKAYLNVNYGSSGQGLQDTAYFWVLPVPILFIGFAILAGLTLLILAVLHRHYSK